MSEPIGYGLPVLTTEQLKARPHTWHNPPVGYIGTTLADQYESPIHAAAQAEAERQSAAEETRLCQSVARFYAAEAARETDPRRAARCADLAAWYAQR